jgi:two-component system, NtrC family, response regulator AtoC
VRELRNTVEHALLSATGDVIEEDHLGIVPAAYLLERPTSVAREGARAAEAVDSLSSAATLSDVERTLIGRALAQTQGNVTQAAKLLGISRDTLRYRIEKHGLVEDVDPALSQGSSGST